MRSRRSQPHAAEVAAPIDLAGTLSSVAARIIAEGAISATQAAGHVPSFRPGKKTSTHVIMSWILKGRGTPRVYLEATKLGGRWVTSRQALARFAETLAAQKIGHRQPTTTPRQRRAEIDCAPHELDRAGFGHR